MLTMYYRLTPEAAESVLNTRSAAFLAIKKHGALALADRAEDA